MADILTSISVPTKPWDDAKRRFLDDIPDDDKAMFEKATLENLFYASSVQFKQHEAESKLAHARRKLGLLLESIEGYGKAIDVLSQSNDVLCPLWGGLRIVLHIALEYEKYYDKLIGMFERIGDLLPRFRTYEALFATHQRLMSCISDVYLDIVDFSYTAGKVFTFKRQASMIQKLQVSRSWKPFESKFDDYIERFRRHQRLIDGEAHLAHMIENKKTQTSVQDQKALQLARASEDEWRKIRDLISTFDYNAKHQSVRSNRHSGTSQWLARHPDYQAWRLDDSATTFCCYGIPGAGKTVLASAIIDHELSSTSKTTQAVCYHYCDYAESSTLDLRTIISNLARQLLDDLGPMPAVSQRCRFPLDTGFSLTVEDSIFCLIQALNEHKQSLIIIDGTDELRPEVFTELLEKMGIILHRNEGKLGQGTKLLLFGRPNERLSRGPLRGAASLTIATENNSPDLQAFIEERLREHLSKGQLILADPALGIEIRERLMVGAEHMFLWARLQLEELCYAPSDQAIRETLSNLPTSLTQLYDRIVTRIASSPGGPRRVNLARNILCWVICAQRPLTIQELGEAVAIEPDDKSLQRDRIVTNELHILDACSNMLILDRSTNTVKLAHHSLKDYLLYDLATPRANGPAPNALQIVEAEAKVYVADSCLTYLCFSDFDTQIANVPQTRSQEIKMSTDQLLPLLAVHSETPMTGHTGRLAQRFRGRSPKPSMTTLNFKATSTSKNSQVAGNAGLQGFAMADYIVHHWIAHSQAIFTGEIGKAHVSATVYERHIKCFSEQGRFAELIFYKQSSLRFRPWEAIDGSRPPSGYPHLALFRWAIDHDAEWLLQLHWLLQLPQSFPGEDTSWQSYYDWDTSLALVDCQVLHPLQRACLAKSTHVLDYFLQEMSTVALFGKDAVTTKQNFRAILALDNAFKIAERLQDALYDNRTSAVQEREAALISFIEVWANMDDVEDRPEAIRNHMFPLAHVVSDRNVGDIVTMIVDAYTSPRATPWPDYASRFQDTLLGLSCVQRDCEAAFNCLLLSPHNFLMSRLYKISPLHDAAVSQGLQSGLLHALERLPRPVDKYIIANLRNFVSTSAVSELTSTAVTSFVERVEKEDYGIEPPLYHPTELIPTDF